MMPPAVALYLQELARTLPPELLEVVARQVEAGAVEPWPAARAAALGAVAQPDVRAAVARLLDAWRAAAGDAPRTPLAWAVQAAAGAAAAVRAEQAIDLVWTGPQVDGPALRRTDQALQEVIDAAQADLLLVSFAVFIVPHIRARLVAAAERGVRIQLVIETSEESEGGMSYDNVRSLHPAVAANAAVYVWPLAGRPRSAGGSPGLLHAKCAVADRRLLFVSSANLTRQALSHNMELGLLVRGGRLPAAVAAHFQRLIERRILVSPASA